MKAVVFGGSGFLGSHVADALTAAGHKAVIFDRNPSKYIQADQDMVVGDILDFDLVVHALRGASAAYHFAGISDIYEANKNPLETVKQNILGTTNVLEACLKAKVARFIFASSIYVYSERGGFYRSSKQACELIIENYSKFYNIDFTILRFGSLYGGRANSFNFIHNVIYQALTQGVMERKGDGEEVRDYIHVLDAAKACVTALNDKFKNDYLMITGAQNVKVKELLLMISEMFGNKVEIKFLKERLEDHYELTPYAFRPRMAHKFVQDRQIDLGQGILDTIYEIYKEVNKKQDCKLTVSLPK